jgi:predicted transcriptional regulator
MVIRDELRKILNIIADKTESNPSSSVIDSGVIRESGLPESEAQKYINELGALGLITVGIKVSGADFRILSITKEGIKELQNQEDR